MISVLTTFTSRRHAVAVKMCHGGFFKALRASRWSLKWNQIYTTWLFETEIIITYYFQICLCVKYGEIALFSPQSAFSPGPFDSTLSCICCSFCYWGALCRDESTPTEPQEDIDVCITSNKNPREMLLAQFGYPNWLPVRSFPAEFKYCDQVLCRGKDLTLTEMWYSQKECCAAVGRPKT